MYSVCMHIQYVHLYAVLDSLYLVHSTKYLVPGILPGTKHTNHCQVEFKYCQCLLKIVIHKTPASFVDKSDGKAAQP